MSYKDTLEGLIEINIGEENANPEPASIESSESEPPANNMAYYDTDNEKKKPICPFSLGGGRMRRCQKENCMAYRHIIDGSGEYVGEYCKLIDRKER